MDAATVATETSTLPCSISASERIFSDIQAKKDEQINSAAQALATEALRLADEARHIAKRLEAIKVKLASMNEASHKLSLSSFSANEYVSDEATPFETDKADAIARVMISWSATVEAADMPTVLTAETRDEPLGNLLPQSTSQDSSASARALVEDSERSKRVEKMNGGMPAIKSQFHGEFPIPFSNAPKPDDVPIGSTVGTAKFGRAPRPVVPEVPSEEKQEIPVAIQEYNSKDQVQGTSNLVVAESVAFKDPVLVQLFMGDEQSDKQVSITPPDDVTSTIKSQQDQPKVVEDMQKDKMRLSGDVKIPRVMVATPTEEKGAFESLMDAMGLDTACGIDEDSLALYAEESIATTVNVNPNKQSVKQHKARTSQSKTAKPLTGDVKVARVVDSTEEKGAFESVMDAMGLDSACGIDEASLALYAEESTASTIIVTPNKRSSRQYKVLTSESTSNDASLIHVFGNTNDDDFVICSKIGAICEPGLADLDEPQIFYTLPTQVTDEAHVDPLTAMTNKMDSALDQPKSILKTHDKEPQGEPNIEVKQLEHPQGIVDVEIHPEEEEIERKRVCFKGAEPEGENLAT